MFINVVHFYYFILMLNDCIFSFFIRLGGAKRLGSEKQSPESDTDSMAEYGEGDTGIYF